MQNDGTLEHAKQIAADESPRTTKLYESYSGRDFSRRKSIGYASMPHPVFISYVTTRRHHFPRFFGGLRECVLERDRFRCRACGARSPLVVHHRDRRKQAESLVTLCIRCHVRIHRSSGFRYWFSAILMRLWRDLHPRDPVQLQLALKNAAKKHTSGNSREKTSVVTMPLFSRRAES